VKEAVTDLAINPNTVQKAYRELDSLCPARPVRNRPDPWQLPGARRLGRVWLPAWGGNPSGRLPVPSDFVGYPEDLGTDLGLKVVNAACPGETTASMINMNGPSNGCQHSDSGGPGFRDLAPLHVSYQGSQLAFAVSYLKQHPGTKLVTIDIGASRRNSTRC
jgi:hypothetical protein